MSAIVHDAVDGSAAPGDLGLSPASGGSPVPGDYALSGGSPVLDADAGAALREYLERNVPMSGEPLPEITLEADLFDLQEQDM